MNKLKQLIADAGLKFRNEMIILIILNALTLAFALAIVIIFKKILFILPFIFLFLLINLVSIMRYVELKRIRNSEMLGNMYRLVKYLYIDINSGLPLIKALENLKGKSDLKTSEYLTILFENIKKDKSVAPYLAFAKNYQSVIIEELFINLYDYNLHKTRNYLERFNKSFYSLSNVYLKERKTRILRRFDFLKSSALLGTLLILVLIMVSVVSVIGEFIHG